ncbi:piggyBac transposable element-derived protein 4-like [Lineus longissimus]|uniref:piggyBac transposable element-derived protein 4-like n=1 Tax=Lineus longissimus TaxID=88925 RepID=UPI00315D363A
MIQSELSGSEGYLRNVDDLVSGSDASNASGHDSQTRDQNIDTDSSGDDVPAQRPRGRPPARGRRPDDPANDRPWSVNDQVRDRYPFTGNPGIKVDIHDTSDPLEFFELFFGDELVDLIVTETNRFARQYLVEKEGTLKARSRAKEWEDTDSDEIRVFLALLLLQGVVFKPEIEVSFSKKASMYTSFFREVIDKERFILLCKFLHFTDNTAFDPEGPIPKKLYKLWPIIEHMKTKFSEMYKPERDMAVDESILL